MKFNRRLLTLAVITSMPAFGVFVVMAATEEIGMGTALAGALVTICLAALVVRPYAADLRDLALYARALTRGDQLPPPTLRTALVADNLASLGQLRRSWREDRESQANALVFHEALLESLPSPLFLVNRQRRIVRANAEARSVFGREVQGRELVAVLRTPSLLDAIEKGLAGETSQDAEFTLAGPSDREFRAQIEPLRRIGLDGAALVVALHDVTALRRMEQMRADFVANASHELRTPLSSLLGFIETLRGPAKDDPEAQERFLAIMFDQAQRMSRLVADLLNLSRIELNEHTRPAGQADLAAILKRITDGLEIEARAHQMRLELAIEVNLPPVAGKEDELIQVFQNLIDNALKYGRSGKLVEIAAKTTANPPAGMTGPSIMVAVRDHGEGIEREHLPRLTERFFRVDPARSRQLGGTGLGLAIVKHLVNRHRGHLAIESALGKGSTFTVYLPAAQPSIQQEMPQKNVKLP